MKYMVGERFFCFGDVTFFASFENDLVVVMRFFFSFVGVLFFAKGAPLDTERNFEGM